MALANSAGTNPLPFKAGGTIAQYRVVKLDSTEGQVVVTSAITDNGFGVSETSATSGEAIRISTVPGQKVKVTVSGAVSLGDQLMPTSSGSGKVVTASGATARSVAIACQAATTDGDIIEAIWLPSLNGAANS